MKTYIMLDHELIAMGDPGVVGWQGNDPLEGLVGRTFGQLEFKNDQARDILEGRGIFLTEGECEDDGILLHDNNWKEICQRLLDKYWDDVVMIREVTMI